MILLNKPLITGKEIGQITQLISEGKKMSGDGFVTRQCQTIIERICRAQKILLTSSCTHALEMSALLAQIGPGDEVIMPSFTFVSTANAFVLRGAKVVFVDIEPATMNIDPECIAAAITPLTKAICVMHYAGVGCDMDRIMEIAQSHHLLVIEDAAQCLGAYFKDKHLGTLGHFGTFSFHDTKNIQCGEGGALLLNDARFFLQSEILREKGTNRAGFIRGEVDKYSWVSVGSSYLMSELNAAFLLPQLDFLQAVTENRRMIWQRYLEGLQVLKSEGKIDLPVVPSGCKHNAHTFFIKCMDAQERHALMQFLKTRGIQSAFHYIPLHSAPAGLLYGRFHGEDRHTTRESERLLRLPLYYGLSRSDIDYTIAQVSAFYNR